MKTLSLSEVHLFTSSSCERGSARFKADAAALDSANIPYHQPVKVQVREQGAANWTWAFLCISSVWPLAPSVSAAPSGSQPRSLPASLPASLSWEPNPEQQAAVLDPSIQVPVSIASGETTQTRVKHLSSGVDRVKGPVTGVDQVRLVLQPVDELLAVSPEALEAEVAVLKPTLQAAAVQVSAPEPLQCPARVNLLLRHRWLQPGCHVHLAPDVTIHVLSIQPSSPSPSAVFLVTAATTVSFPNTRDGGSSSSSPPQVLTLSESLLASQFESLSASQSEAQSPAGSSSRAVNPRTTAKNPAVENPVTVPNPAVENPVTVPNPAVENPVAPGRDPKAAAASGPAAPAATGLKLKGAAKRNKRESSSAATAATGAKPKNSATASKGAAKGNSSEGRSAKGVATDPGGKGAATAAQGAAAAAAQGAAAAAAKGAAAAAAKGAADTADKEAAAAAGTGAADTAEKEAAAAAAQGAAGSGKKSSKKASGSKGKKASRGSIDTVASQFDVLALLGDE